MTAIPGRPIADLVRTVDGDTQARERCQLKHAAVVNAYVEARAEIIRFNDKAKAGAR